MFPRDENTIIQFGKKMSFTSRMQSAFWASKRDELGFLSDTTVSGDFRWDVRIPSGGKQGLGKPINSASFDLNV